MSILTSRDIPFEQVTFWPPSEANSQDYIFFLAIRFANRNGSMALLKATKENSSINTNKNLIGG